MKLVLVAYNEAIEEELAETLEASGVKHYTKWTKVLGSGYSGGLRLDTHIWPGANNVVALMLNDEKAAEIMAGIRELKENRRGEGLKAFLLPVDDVT